MCSTRTGRTLRPSSCSASWRVVDKLEKLAGADALAIVTEWNEFRNPDFEVMIRLLRQPVIFDGRNVFDLARMTALGFTYHGMGRAAVDSGSAPKRQ